MKVYLTRYGEALDDDGEGQRLGTDPAPLFWSHSDYQGQTDARLVASLPPKTHQFVDFLVAHEVGAEPLELLSPTHDDRFLSAARSARGARVEFMAVDENGNHSFKNLEFVWDGTSTSLRWKV